MPGKAKKLDLVPTFLRKSDILISEQMQTSVLISEAGQYLSLDALFFVLGAQNIVSIASVFCSKPRGKG